MKRTFDVGGLQGEISDVYLGGGHFSPHRMPVANEGLGWDPL